jgi:hypothetical protein
MPFALSQPPPSPLPSSPLTSTPPISSHSHFHP